MLRALFPAVSVCAVGLAGGHASAEDFLRLWGIDGADAQLFAIDDVNDPYTTFVDYGPLHIAEGYRALPLSGKVSAFSVVNTYDAFAVVHEPVGEHAAPVLVHLDLREIDVGVPVVASVVASLADSEWDPAWTVTGIAGDPLHSVMYVLTADGDPATNDRLSRVRMDSKRVIHTESLGEIRWAFGGVRMGADITLGPAGLLLVADEHEGRIVMVEPDTGQVRGVRIEGVRVDDDPAAYAGVAWDGYNDRTAMFDRRTGMLVVDDRTANAISAFDLRGTGITDTAGLEFVFQPTPPGQGDSSGSRRMQGVHNVDAPDRFGGRGGGRAGGGGGGGGSSSPFIPRDLLDDIPDSPGDDPGENPDPATDPPGPPPRDDRYRDLDESYPPPGGNPPGPNPPPGDDPPPGEPEGEDPPKEIPAPGALSVLILGALSAGRRRNRRGP
jgi:hypothetical protein